MWLKLFWDLMAGYLYNYQTREFYNLSYAQEVPEGPARFGGLLINPSIWLSTPYLKRLSFMVSISI